MLFSLVRTLVKVAVASLVVGTVLTHFGVTADELLRASGLSTEATLAAFSAILRSTASVMRVRISSSAIPSSLAQSVIGRSSAKMRCDSSCRVATSHCSA